MGDRLGIPGAVDFCFFLFLRVACVCIFSALAVCLQRFLLFHVPPFFGEFAICLSLESSWYLYREFLHLTDVARAFWWECDAVRRHTDVSA